MKKRILIATISVIVLICTILAVSVWAADTEAPKLKIAAKNLSFSDSVYIVYYVDAQNASASDVKLLVWDTPQTEYTVQNASTALPCLYTETISGKTYLRFEYRALAAKQMADTVYTRAYVSANGQSYYSDLTSYSILQYAYNKLGKTGSAPTTNENLKTLLTDMLSYGASAQRYFNYNTDRLATDTFYQINTVGSTLPDGTTSGLFKNGESFTLTAPAPAQGFTFSGWKTSGGILVSTANSISVTVNGSNETYSAIYCADDVSNYSKTVVAPTANDDGYTLYYCEGCGDSYRADYVPATGSIGLAYTVNSDGETCTITGKGSCNDTELNIPAYIGNYKVTEIGGSAFRGDTTLRSVRISEGITSIGTSAFSNCTALYTVFLPESLETISSYAFYNCSYLTTHLTIPKNVSSIGGRAFYGCTKLKEIYYEGTADEWNAITIGALNAPLTSATLHCTYKQNITFINEGTATIDAIKDNTYTSMFPISNQLIKKDGYNGKGNATAWVSYSNKGIYIYAEVKDDTVSVTSGVDGDLFQVYVDFVNDHVSTGLAGNDYRTKHGTSGSKKLGWIAIKPDGTSTPSWGFSGVTIESAAKTITGGYAVEFFVPFHTSTLPGTSFGMGFEVKDDTDNDGSRDSVYYDSASGTQYYMNYDKLTDYSFFEDNTPSVEKVEYSSVKIALDGQKDAAYSMALPGRKWALYLRRSC